MSHFYKDDHQVVRNMMADLRRSIDSTRYTDHMVTMWASRYSTSDNLVTIAYGLDRLFALSDSRCRDKRLEIAKTHDGWLNDITSYVVVPCTHWPRFSLPSYGIVLHRKVKCGPYDIESLFLEFQLAKTKHGSVGHRLGDTIEITGVTEHQMKFMNILNASPRKQ